MRTGARLAAAIELLDRWHEKRDDADRIADAYFRKRRYIGGGDRRAVNDRFHQLIRHQARLGWWIARSGLHPPDGRARVISALALIDGLDRPAIERSFGAGPYDPPALRPEEIAYLDGLRGRGVDHPGQPAWVKAELPRWLHDKLFRQYRDDLAAEMAALNRPAHLDLRVNTLKTDRPGAIAALKADGFDAEPITGLETGLRLAPASPVTQGAAYRDGLVEVQDAASQICAMMVDPAPGGRVLDMCAGAGGKSLAIAALMGGRGRIVAADVHQGRLDNARIRARRAGIGNIRYRRLADEHDRWLRGKAGFFDRVLIDAPCSGSGTWRRNPAGRWRLDPGHLTKLVRLQAGLIRAGARRVDRGGRLIYATCSLLHAENEAIVERFLKDARDFTPIEVKTLYPGAGEREGPWLRLGPRSDGTDGFFIAVLRKRNGNG